MQFKFNSVSKNIQIRIISPFLSELQGRNEEHKKLYE